jgi:imidazolonepropionase-like amidohydrolase
MATERVDSVEHGHLIDAEGIKLMLDHGTFLVPTLAAVRGIVDAPAGAGIPAAVLSKANALAGDAERNAFDAPALVVKAGTVVYRRPN